MRLIPILMMTCLLCFKFNAALASFAPPRILVVGDSLSAAYGIERKQGWVQLLQQRLQDRALPHEVINASVSGDTTRTGLGRLPSALQQHHPDIVIIALGGNDGLRALPFDEIETSLSKMISTAQAAGAKVLLAGVRLPPNNGPVYNRLFGDIYQRLSQQYDIPLVTRMLDQVSDHAELMQADGIHPVAAAQTRILDNVWQQLQSMLSNS